MLYPILLISKFARSKFSILIENKYVVYWTMVVKSWNSLFDIVRKPISLYFRSLNNRVFRIIISSWRPFHIVQNPKSFEVLILKINHFLLVILYTYQHLHVESILKSVECEPHLWKNVLDANIDLKSLMSEVVW